MTITVEWDNADKTIIRWDFVGIWEWQEVYAAAEMSGRLRNEVTHSVSVILNLEKATNMKQGALTHTKTVLSFNPDNRDLVIAAGPSAFLHSMVEIFRKMNVSMADKFLGVDSVKEARKVIAARRAENGS
jgi:hypothetical protein